MITRSVHEEDQRKRAEAQMAHLQQQVDELRRQLKEQAARDVRAEEYWKQVEGRIANFNTMFESHRQEEGQAEHVRRLEDQRWRKNVSEIQERLEDPFKPIRQLQAQVQELMEQRRHDKEQVGAEQRQYEALQRKIDEVSAHISLSSEQWRQAQEAIGRLHEMLEQGRREASQLGEAIRMEEQRIRRQYLEFSQLVEEARNDTRALVSRVSLLDEQRKGDRADVDSIPPRIEGLGQRLDATAEEIQKVEKRAATGHMDALERLEEIRQEMDAQLTALHHLGDQRADRFVVQLQAVDDHVREVEVRLATLPPRLDELFERDEDHTTSLVELEESLLQRRLAQVQQELDDLHQRRAKLGK